MCHHETTLTVLVSGFALEQGLPTFLLPCTPSAFRKMSMYPFSILTDKYVPLQHFDRRTGTSEISHDNTFYHDYA